MSIIETLEPTLRNASYQDVLDAPAGKVAELLSGRLHLQPRPTMPHAYASSNLLGELIGPFGKGQGGPGGWWIVVEPELHLGEDILVPDIAGWRRETMPEFPLSAYTELAPDWVCEILSPSTRRIDRHEKRAIYAQNSVQWLWLIDPDEREMEAFERQGHEWLLIATLKDDDPVAVRPFDAISFELSALWP